MLLYCCLRTRVLDTPNLPHASLVFEPQLYNQNLTLYASTGGPSNNNNPVLQPH